MTRQTIASPVTVEGTGLHTGLPCSATLRPTSWGEGRHFVQDGAMVPATLPHARAEPGCMVLVNGQATVRTPEHLLAACSALGVTDLRIDLAGPEVPALDGSAQGWVNAIDQVGRVSGPPLTPWSPEHTFAVEISGGRARLGPGDQIAVEVDFEDGPTGALSLPLDEASFRKHVMWARTFVLARDIERLRASGRGQGANAENTAVWPDGPLRSPDEPVRHKLLDAWGDLALLGPCRASLHVVRGSHALHLALWKAIFPQ